MNSRRPAGRYVVCLSNAGYPASLIPRRIYRMVPDVDAHKRGLVRVIDESGEDYLYPGRLFLAIELPKEVARRFGKSSSNQPLQRPARTAGRR